MSPRIRSVRVVALVTSLTLAALFVAYRVTNASKPEEASPAPVAPSAAGGDPAAGPAPAAKPTEDATEEPEYFPGSKSLIGIGGGKPARRSPKPPAPKTPETPPQAPQSPGK
jgi:hypothetical protein